MRQEWDDKWMPGRHAADILNAKNAVNKAIKEIAKECRPTV